MIDVFTNTFHSLVYKEIPINLHKQVDTLKLAISYITFLSEMVKKDKNGNEPGLSLQRNYQKEPPKKIILKDRSKLSIIQQTSIKLACEWAVGVTLCKPGRYLIT